MSNYINETYLSFIVYNNIKTFSLNTLWRILWSFANNKKKISTYSNIDNAINIKLLT